MDLEEIISDIKKKSLLECSKNSVLEFDLNRYLRNGLQSDKLTLLLHSANINYYRELNGNAIVIFVKRVIRRLIRFCVLPCITDISSFNNCNVRMLMDMREELNKTERKILTLEKEIEMLRENNR